MVLGVFLPSGKAVLERLFLSLGKNALRHEKIKTVSRSEPGIGEFFKDGSELRICRHRLLFSDEIFSFGGKLVNASDCDVFRSFAHLV